MPEILSFSDVKFCHVAKLTHTLWIKIWNLYVQNVKILTHKLNYKTKVNAKVSDSVEQRLLFYSVIVSFQP